MVSLENVHHYLRLSPVNCIYLKIVTCFLRHDCLLASMGPVDPSVQNPGKNTVYTMPDFI